MSFFSRCVPAALSIMRRAPYLTTATIGSGVALGVGCGFRYYQTHDDKILTKNPQGTTVPVLESAEKYRQIGNSSMPPWVTQDSVLLNVLAKNFPGYKVQNPNELVPPYLSPVKISAKSIDSSSLTTLESEPIFVAVGGFPAAVIALKKAIEGHKVYYVNYKGEPGKMMRAISDGAAWHFEPEAFSEAPAYTAGKNPTVFFKNELYELIFPSRFDSATSGNVLSPNHRWLSLNIQDWICNPSQWSEGVRVALGNQKLAWQYESEIRQGKVPKVIQEMALRTKQSEQTMIELNAALGGQLFLENKKGSLIVFSTEEAAKDFPAMQKSLQAEGRGLNILTFEQVKEKYGFIPKNAYAIAEKTEDRIINPNAIELIAEEIEKRGGTVRTDARLKEVQVDINAPGKTGMVILEKKNHDGTTKDVKQKFSSLYSSLGFTDYSPHQADLASVRGTSVTAMVSGVNFTGGPVVCDSNSSVHFVPISKTIDGKTLVRITEAGQVGPRNLGMNAHHFRIKDLVNLEALSSGILPEGAKLDIISAYGCNRAFASEGALTLKNPIIPINGEQTSVPNVVIMQGAGGGGITQGGTPVQFT